MLNKPRGVVSTLDDPEGRRDLREFLADRKERLFHVGRLDTETTGLLILTNDGEFAQRVAHPSYEVPKTYLAEVAGIVTPAALNRLRKGVRLEDGPVRPDAVKVVSTGGERSGDKSAGKSLVRITLHEGRNRIVRRTMEAVGHPVTTIVPGRHRADPAGQSGGGQDAGPDSRGARDCCWISSASPRLPRPTSSTTTRAA